MKRILARLVDQNNNLLREPNPSYTLIEGGRPIRNYTVTEIEDLALDEIARARNAPLGAKQC